MLIQLKIKLLLLLLLYLLYIFYVFLWKQSEF
uniref:leu operon leader peptide n=1 Tax=Buchnera aphidicola subsp. Rhopalosiphum padi TaxID=98793 RepID=LPL_BUCRP|nr:RecName: Full=leu operon leader peptide; AltName: Full=leu operon attenuator peptide [Buchnera aphidicola (Rhopalosiphum padi)]CAA50613.1 leu operon leader peptide [Buchnera aphidicola]